MQKLFTLLSVCLSLLAQAQTTPAVEEFATGFNEPLDIDHAFDDRIFITERLGVIKIIHPGGAVTTFMDIQERVGSDAGEQGLLGIVFHPDYAENGYFYANYTDTLGDTHVVRFSRDAINPDLADVNSEMTLFTADQPANNHNGGDLKFGPDGYLYVFMGDGGGAGHNRSQDLGLLFGKILRLDVDGGSPYAIPADNPFVGVPGSEEIFAMGLRNPWRNSFDRLTGDLYIGDVGGDSWEEIDVIKVDTAEFMNFGWKCYEGFMLRAGTICDSIVPDFDFPVFVYPHNIDSGGFAVTGGYVYRGTNYPLLYGHYIFCDYISGKWWTMEPDGAGGYTTTPHGYILDHVTSFGEDVSGELYVCDNTSGKIFRVVEQCSAFSVSATVTNASTPATANGAIDVTVAGAASPVTYVWNTGATTLDIAGLLPGTYFVTVTDANGCLHEESYVVGANCAPATGIVTTPTATSVFIDWNDMGATAYRVMYKPAGGGAWTQVNTPVSSITLTGLSPSTAYSFRIRHKCPGVPGMLSANGNFITNPLRFGEQEVQVYPNPAQQVLHIEGMTEGTLVYLLNIEGRIVCTQICSSETIMDIAHLPAGIYVLRDADGAWIKKIQLIK